MINRVSTHPRIRHDLAGAMVGLVVGALVAGTITYTATSNPDPSGDREVCVAAAERAAQLDATWQKFTKDGTVKLSTADAGVIDRARDASVRFLVACRGYE